MEQKKASFKIYSDEFPDTSHLLTKSEGNARFFNIHEKETLQNDLDCNGNKLLNVNNLINKDDIKKYYQLGTILNMKETKIVNGIDGEYDNDYVTKHYIDSKKAEVLQEFDLLKKTFIDEMSKIQESIPKLNKIPDPKLFLDAVNKQYCDKITLGIFKDSCDFTKEKLKEERSISNVDKTTLMNHTDNQVSLLENKINSKLDSYSLIGHINYRTQQTDIDELNQKINELKHQQQQQNSIKTKTIIKDLDTELIQLIYMTDIGEFIIGVEFYFIIDDNYYNIDNKYIIDLFGDCYIKITTDKLINLESKSTNFRKKITLICSRNLIENIKLEITILYYLLPTMKNLIVEEDIPIPISKGILFSKNTLDYLDNK
jgi:hypothetical protein